MNESIRVLHILGGMNQGGTENFLMNVYKNINREKIQFDFLVSRKGIFDDEIKKMGGNIYYMPALQEIGQYKYVKKLRQFFRQHPEYKIVHSHLNQVTGLILEVANQEGIPARIAHIHSSKPNKNMLVRIYKKYLGSKVLKNATDLWACSKIAGEWLYGKKSKNVKIINNAIELEKFKYSPEIRKKVREKFEIPEETFLVGNVGRLTYEKNQVFLFRILKELKKIDENTKLMLVGKGDLKQQLVNTSKELGIENSIIWLEDRRDVNELMQAMDYFIFPSVSEGLGIVLIEAQSSGLRCIASDKVIPEEAKVTDLLQFYPLDESAQNWAKEVYSKRKYNREIKLDEIKQKKYDVKDVAEYIEKLYEDILKERIESYK